MGDLSKQIEVDARGEILDLKNTVNGMVVRCASFLSILSFSLCSALLLRRVRRFYSHFISEHPGYAFFFTRIPANEPQTFPLYRLRALAAEVTRVTLEVGSQGKLGGQAHVPDVEGVWLNLVRNVSWSDFLFGWVWVLGLGFFIVGGWASQEIKYEVDDDAIDG